MLSSLGYLKEVCLLSLWQLISTLEQSLSSKGIHIKRNKFTGKLQLCTSQWEIKMQKTQMLLLHRSHRIDVTWRALTKCTVCIRSKVRNIISLFLFEGWMNLTTLWCNPSLVWKGLQNEQIREVTANYYTPAMYVWCSELERIRKKRTDGKPPEIGLQRTANLFCHISFCSVLLLSLWKWISSSLCWN